MHVCVETILNAVQVSPDTIFHACLVCVVAECLAGTFLDGTECSPCTFGTYQPTDHSSTTCINCPTGTTTQAQGSTDSNDCKGMSVDSLIHSHLNFF